MVTIVQSNDPVLRECAQTVPAKDIGSQRIQKIIADMKIALASQDDGVAIAAPQIGEALRIFLVSDEIMKKADETYKGAGKDLIFINPKISKLSREKSEVEEGCLSVRWKYGMVNRSVKATVKGYNELGEKVERGASGLLAQVFQHECDHLDGILFIDKAFNVRDMPPESEAE
jgi:peptide deformylase